MTAQSRNVHYGMTLSSEEHDPGRLVDLAQLAEENGFDFVSISDHFHPWVDEQGHSPFVWGVLGAIAERTRDITVGVGVTCPTVRIHPAVCAQATATAACLLEGRFVWGVGSGEALNEHILGDRWPPADVRLEMLQEAIAVVRELWTGRIVTRRGTHYVVENARIYDAPPGEIPIIVSAYGPRAAEVAARCGDGLWISGSSIEAVEAYRRNGGSGPVFAQVTLCFGHDRDEAVRTAHRIWPNMGVPGQLSQDLPTPAHFEQAASIVTEEMVASSAPCGPEPGPVLDKVDELVAAGVDNIYFHQIGPDQEGFCRFWRQELQPALVERAAA